jgi:hypothetical protein
MNDTKMHLFAVRSTDAGTEVQNDCCRKCRRRGRRLIVESRKGGFVSKDCEFCGASNYITATEIPPVPCVRCANTQLVARDYWSNYVLKCLRCRTQTLLAQLLPRWDDLYPFDGLPIHNPREG